MKSLFSMIAIMGLCAALVGCESDSKKADDKAKDKVAQKKNSGKKKHAHAHGPNGDVMFTIEELDLHGELLVDKNSNNVTIAFCDDHGEKAVAVKLNKISISYDNGEEIKSYDLAAVDPKDGAAVKYAWDDEELHMIAKNKPFLNVTMGDKTAKIRLPMPH